MTAAIEVMGLSKRYGDVAALTDVSFAVPRGSVLGLLGHNGAGKSTLIGILSTLSRPDAGSAQVAGFDVVRQGAQVRQRIGLTGQTATLDEQISGRQNLVLIGRLLGTTRGSAEVRAQELLDLFDLCGAGDRKVRTYSGGMRRRLDLAASLVGRPDVIFLDEPTVGLDPTGRLAMWEVVRAATRDGATVLLTTQYLDEADQLSDSIVVMAGGTVVAAGSPNELKARVGNRTITARCGNPHDGRTSVLALRAAGFAPLWDAARLAVTIPAVRTQDIVAFGQAIAGCGVEMAEISFTEPNLDDVFHAFSG
ncbi:ATP-binding cassette domain-containing protein [Streptosporangium sp. NPDC006930]|uniref:ATP-binding cassette domain-containing protein n=1 Tax=unclassified Streptosporangium TaxID=2632669 RepID=UPI003423B6A1